MAEIKENISMADDDKFAIFVKDETVAQSIYKDVVTGIMVSFCVYISQGSTWWTFITGLMFLIFFFSKVKTMMKMRNSFKCKKDLQAWVDTLPEP